MKHLSILAALLAALFGISGSLPQDGFYSVCGQYIIDSNGDTAVFKGIGFGNSCWDADISVVSRHHNEQSYKEISELGFNSVRFLLNYRWFEDDETPYSYKEEGFEMLDQNIAWAKKYGIGLILNMHYPQGGYQSQGKGIELWTNRQNQERLTALWGEIARRYADESAIIGYGFINEPVVPKLATEKATISQCSSLMQRIADEVRKYDSKHLLFIESVCGIKNTKTGVTDWTCTKERFFLIDDSLAVYERHFYEPTDFTHQAELDDVSYPSAGYVPTDFINWWTGSESLQSEPMRGGWFKFESAELSAKEGANVLCPTLGAWKIGGENAYYDEIAVTETTPDGVTKTVYFADFSKGASYLGTWSDDGSGEVSFDSAEGHRNAGCIKLCGAESAFTISLCYIPMREGCTYKLSGYAKCNAPADGSAYISASYALAESYERINADYLQKRLDEISSFARENNVPFFLGEFGSDSASFNGLGGEKWVGDVLEWCTQNEVCFSYHAYHESMFGLYPDDADFSVSVRNEPLANVFRQKLLYKTAA